MTSFLSQRRAVEVVGLVEFTAGNLRLHGMIKAHRFDEALLFILPGYFAGLLVVETKCWPMLFVCLGSLITAVAGAVVSSGWGWLATAIGVATLVWGVEQWKLHASRSF